jgi:hypothetical protein
MNKQTPHSPAIPVTFVNGFSYRQLCQAVLPTLPHPGDFLNLGFLAYQVTGHNWRLTPEGLVEIDVVLLPQLNETGDRPFFYPEEDQLPAVWGQLAFPAEETTP